MQFDGGFYGCPHGTYIDWSDFDPAVIPNLICARTSKEATQLIEQALGKRARRRRCEARRRPRASRRRHRRATPSPEVLLETIGDYNIVGYEGWIYGIPLTVGALDLTETDVTELPGVIKDVARDVVVNEINYLIERERAVAAE